MTCSMIFIPADVAKGVEYIESMESRDMGKRIGAGMIERVRVGPNESLAVDEEGLYTSKTLNVRASVLYGTPQHGAPIMGDVLFGIEHQTMDGLDWAETDEVTLKERLLDLLITAENALKQ